MTAALFGYCPDCGLEHWRNECIDPYFTTDETDNEGLI